HPPRTLHARSGLGPIARTPADQNSTATTAQATPAVSQRALKAASTRVQWPRNRRQPAGTLNPRSRQRANRRDRRPRKMPKVALVMKWPSSEFLVEPFRLARQRAARGSSAPNLGKAGLHAVRHGQRAADSASNLFVSSADAVRLWVFVSG